MNSEINFLEDLREKIGGKVVHAELEKIVLQRILKLERIKDILAEIYSEEEADYLDKDKIRKLKQELEELRK